MLIPHLIENIFRSRLTLVSSNDKITIKINVKNPKKINKQSLFKQNFNGPSNGQKIKKIMCKYSLLKEYFKRIIIP